MLASGPSNIILIWDWVTNNRRYGVFPILAIIANTISIVYHIEEEKEEEKKDAKGAAEDKEEEPFRFVRVVQISGFYSS